MDKEVGKARLLKMMLKILDQPNRYTKKELAERYGVSESMIKKDFETLRNVGLSIDCDDNYRYAFKLEKPFNKLRDLLYFSDEDQELLRSAIDKVETHKHSHRADQLKRKLDSLYDYHELGLAYLRKPYLRKIDILKEAESKKKVVVVYAYHSSNSNTVKDRKLEPFHVSPDEDLLHAYDIDIKKLRHFRISRMGRISIVDADWEYQGHHRIMSADPFRIVNDDQIMVHLRLKVGAYNELIERFPLTKRYVEPSAEEDGIFDFQCKVNCEFIGLTNFILGFYHQLIEVVGPDELIIHLGKEIEKFQKKLGVGKRLG